MKEIHHLRPKRDILTGEAIENEREMKIVKEIQTRTRTKTDIGTGGERRKEMKRERETERERGPVLHPHLRKNGVNALPLLGH